MSQGDTVDTLNGHPQTRILPSIPQGVQGDQGDRLPSGTLEVDDLLYPASHLRYLGFIVKMTSLYGTEYMPFWKATWYRSISLAVGPKTIRVGDILTDSRFHVAVAIPSGKGKNAFQTTISAVCRGLSLEYVEPASLHPEQMIGRMIEVERDGATVRVPNPGHLAAHAMDIDEATELVRSQERADEEVRKSIRKATNVYGQSPITKRLVGHQLPKVKASSPR